MSIQEYIQHRAEEIESELDQLVPEMETPYGSLFKAARYSLKSPGKRLRPTLCIATVQVLGGNPTAALKPACCLEMIHTYSMIHDDLPAMDNDDYRRGVPSLHKVFPQSHAILAGDFLLTHAFETLVKIPGLSADQKIELIRILSEKSGGKGMIGGQVMDLESEDKEVDLETLKQLHEMKTGALISASIEFGAVIANASSDHKNVLKEFGNDMGLAFQIVDDILDVTSKKKKRGSEESSDVRNHKSTYVSLMGLKEANEASLALLKSAQEKLQNLPFDTKILQEIATLIVSRDH